MYGKRRPRDEGIRSERGKGGRVGEGNAPERRLLENS